MSIWGFVIPIINLYKPYRIAKEIVIETQNQLKEMIPNYQEPPNFAIIRVWWILFLITNYIGKHALKSAFKTDTVEQLITSSQIYLVSDFVDIIAAFVTIMMIKTIAEKEQTLFEQFNEPTSIN